MNWKEFFLGKPQSPKSPSVDMDFFMQRGFSQDQAKQIMETALRLSPKSPAPGSKSFRPKASSSSAIDEARLANNPDDMLKLGFMKEMDLREFTKNTFNVANALMAIWTQAVDDRRTYHGLALDLRKFYIVEAILDLMAEDVLNPDEEGKFMEIESDDSKVQSAIDEFLEDIDLNMIVSDICRDLIDFGEYTLRLKVEKDKGVVGIYDDVDPLNVLAMYEHGYPRQYLRFSSEKRDFTVEPASCYAHFVTGNNRIRIAINDVFLANNIEDDAAIPQELRDELPDYIRIGTPLFLGKMSKLRELQLLEQLIPATKLNQLTQSQLVSVKVPAGEPPEKVFKLIKRYEQVLNVPTGIDTNNDQISLAEVMTVTGRIRILPNFSDEKGSLQRLDVREHPPVDDILNSVKDIRAIILSSIGIPPSLLFGSTEGDKVAELRLFSRYTRRLAGIQRAIARGVKQIVLTHLVNTGHEDVNYDTIKISFPQDMVDYSGLEKLEFDDAKQEIVGRTIDFLDKILNNPLLRDQADQQVLLDWVEDKFTVLMGEKKLFPKNPTKLVDIGMDDLDPSMTNNQNTASQASPKMDEPKSNDVTLDQ